MRSETARFRKPHRLKPELGHAVTMLNMNVRRLRSLQAIEKEAISGCSKDGWHRRMYDGRYAVLDQPSMAMCQLAGVSHTSSISSLANSARSWMNSKRASGL